MMTAEKWIVLLATCLACVSSNDGRSEYGESDEQELCKSHKVGALLGSPTLLPCRFSPGSNNTVTWTHVEHMDVVRLSLNGNIHFTDHRYGRVKAFPNQASEGNFSIRIDDLTESDLGLYHCRQDDVCHQVELFIDSSQSELMKLLIWVGAAVGLLILLSAGAYCCYKCCFERCCNTAGDRHKPVITVSSTVTVADDRFVYENDDQCPSSADHSRNHGFTPPTAPPLPAGQQPGHSSAGIYPNLNQFNFEREESQKRRQRFHIDLFTRLREASVRRHYYGNITTFFYHFVSVRNVNHHFYFTVNQVELNQQQVAAAAVPAESHHRAGHGKKKNKKKCEYTNPIYNRSTDRLDRI
ncbi:uncharacterized protein LOC115400132 isoform X2 [Salarias fasciatus]|uniref:uncharacterized protein LOC115400132 isoform X2 n=1 Tax=Salarias fasciatus TaxID=181472 RepID=UPI001176CE89|nr:uncharacterized protein LOC115400132 isoform X2 [Salarias fasciatus]